MIAMTSDTTFRDALAQLQAGASAVPWSQRRELGRALGEALATGSTTDAALTLTHQLAADPKWEVRSTVADLLPLVPDDDFCRLSVRLVADSNAFVRRSAAKAIEQRREAQQAAGRARRSADLVGQSLQAIEAEFGKAAASKAMRMCERHSELLVASMVHDLRSILTHLKTNCFALIDENQAGPDTKRQKYVGRVRDNIEFLEMAVRDMATFARPVPPERRPERLVDVIAAALDLARNNVRRGKTDPDCVMVQVKVRSSIVVEIARNQIVLALANVLQNAFEAFMVSGGMLSDGRIRVTATLLDSLVELVIADDGMGLSDEEASALLLFTPGRRNKTKHYSTGYGLPIAARNLTAHGGSLSLDSKEDAGTTVTIRLPLAIQ